MKRMVLMASLATCLLSGCLMYTGPEGSEAVIVPPLPVIVELDLDPFYYHGGYYYHYHDDHRWSYSHSKSGPWHALPRGHYPKEVKWKKKGPGWGYHY